MDEAFSFEKLFFRSDRKMTNLGGEWGVEPEKVLGIILFMGGLNSPLSSEGQCLSRAQLHQQNISPLVSNSLWFLLSLPSQDNCTALGCSRGKGAPPSNLLGMEECWWKVVCVQWEDAYPKITLQSSAVACCKCGSRQNKAAG